MPKVGVQKSDNEIQAFHARAKDAAAKGVTMKEFAKKEGTLANNVQARLYKAILLGLEPVKFKEPESGSRKRRKQPNNVTLITLYTGRAKVPYLTLKVPSEIVARAGNEGDAIEWDFQRGRIIGRPVKRAGGEEENAS